MGVENTFKESGSVRLKDYRVRMVGIRIKMKLCLALLMQAIMVTVFSQDCGEGKTNFVSKSCVGSNGYFSAGQVCA